jgi:hypothetical protein
VVCGVKVSCGPGALAHGVSPELPWTPQQIDQLEKFTLIQQAKRFVPTIITKQ